MLAEKAVGDAVAKLVVVGEEVGAGVVVGLSTDGAALGLPARCSLLPGKALVRESRRH